MNLFQRLPLATLRESPTIICSLPFICVPFASCVCQCVITRYMTISSLHGELPEDRHFSRLYLHLPSISRGLNAHSVLSRKIRSVKSELICVSCVWTRPICRILLIHGPSFNCILYISSKVGSQTTYFGVVLSECSSFSTVVETQQSSLPNERIDMNLTYNPEITKG